MQLQIKLRQQEYLKQKNEEETKKLEEKQRT